MKDRSIRGTSTLARRHGPARALSAAATMVAATAMLGATCSATASATPSAAAAPTSVRKIVAVGAENEYANVVSQIGGRYVSATAIMSNPSTDPHTFEASPRVAEAVEAAQLVVQNGVGYDTFMNKIEAASPNAKREVIDVQDLLGLPSSTPNPHLWYKPTTMPAVAKAVAKDLSAIQPAHKAYFETNATRFIRSLAPWARAIAKLRVTFPHAPVATTEPVSDYMLQAAGLDNMTPWALQADIMNGVDPSPQAVAYQDSLFKQHKVRVFVYNQQVTNTVTQGFLKVARHDHIPVVGVYETMPEPGYIYQTWMLAETNAVFDALAHRTSTTRL